MVPLLRGNQEAQVLTGELEMAFQDHDKMVMLIEAVVSLIRIALKTAGMITERKIRPIEPVRPNPPRDTCKVFARSIPRETFLTTLRRYTLDLLCEPYILGASCQ